jgi:hypothetical protein
MHSLSVRSRSRRVGESHARSALHPQARRFVVPPLRLLYIQTAMTIVTYFHRPKRTRKLKAEAATVAVNNCPVPKRLLIDNDQPR